MLTTIASFRDPPEAHLFRSRLAAEGILAVVSHDQHIWMSWPYSTALGGAKVQVPISDSEAALVVLSRSLAGDYRAELEDAFGYRDSRRCPKCGSTEFMRRPAFAQVGIVIALLVLFRRHLSATAGGLRLYGVQHQVAKLRRSIFALPRLAAGSMVCGRGERDLLTGREPK
jgi:hypothetical protein